MTGIPRWTADWTRLEIFEIFENNREKGWKRITINIHNKIHRTSSNHDQKWESCHRKWESIARMRMSGTSIVRRIWKDQNLEKTHAQNLELVVVAHPVLQGAKSQGKLHPFFLRLDWEEWSDPPPALLSHHISSHLRSPGDANVILFPGQFHIDVLQIPVLRNAEGCVVWTMIMLAVGYTMMFLPTIFSVHVGMFFLCSSNSWQPNGSGSGQSTYQPRKQLAQPVWSPSFLGHIGETSILQSVCFMDCPVASQNLRKLPSTSINQSVQRPQPRHEPSIHVMAFQPFTRRLHLFQRPNMHRLGFWFHLCDDWNGSFTWWSNSSRSEPASPPRKRFGHGVPGELGMWSKKTCFNIYWRLSHTSQESQSTHPENFHSVIPVIPQTGHV